MRGLHFTSIFCVIMMLLLVGSISNVSVAEVKTLKIEISDVISLMDAIKIRRLLSPWADAKDITFHKPVDKNGKERHFTTAVEIVPRRGVSKYSETNTFDVYDIMRQLKDSRYRGRHGIGQVRLLKTEATVTGTVFAYPGFVRSNIRDIPRWARWRPTTSEIHHAIKVGKNAQNFVFTHSAEFDQLRNDIANINREVEMEGKIVGFDGPYPILRVQTYKLGKRVNRRDTPTGKKPMEGENTAENEKHKYDYLQYDR